MNKPLTTVVASLHALPGFAIMATRLGTPPGREILFGCLMEVVGVLMLLLLLVNQKRLKTLSTKAITITGCATGLGCLFAVYLYWIAFSLCVVSTTNPKHLGEQPAYFPLFGMPQKMSETIAAYGSRQAVVDKFTPAAVNLHLDQMSGIEPAKLGTDIVLSICYQLVFSLLAITFGLFGLYLQESSNGQQLTSPTGLSSGNSSN